MPLYILPIIRNPDTEDKCNPYLHPCLLHAMHLSVYSPLWKIKNQRTLVEKFSNHQCVFHVTKKKIRLVQLRGSRSTDLCKWLHKYGYTTNAKHRTRCNIHIQKKTQGSHRKLLMSSVDCSFDLCPTRLDIGNDMQIMQQWRAIKTVQEITRMQKACDISCKAIQHMVENASTYTNTRRMLNDGMDILRRTTKRTDDFDITAYTTILTVNGYGKHITQKGIKRVHPTFERQALHHHTKPLLLLDMGARYGGYCADITRTFSTTTPTDRQIDMYRSVLSLYELGESMVKPGVLYKDIDHAVKKRLEMELQRLGFKDFTNVNKYMPHSLGHSIGIEVHDTPSIFDIGPLQPNMVLTIEPGIYTEEMDIRIENTIVVTKDGCRVLSNKTPWNMEWFCRSIK